MNCETVQTRLGEYHDGEFDAPFGKRIEEHVAACDACRHELDALRALADRLESAPFPDAPAELWANIAARLKEATPPRSALPPPRFWQPYATAAAVIAAVSLGWLFTTGPGPSTAVAHDEMDFTPLLNRVGDDLELGLRALIDGYGGRAITLEEARRTMTVRVHPPESLPGNMRLKSTHLVNMGHHESLAFHFAGPNGQMLVLQCPPGMRKLYGGRECLPCTIGSRSGLVVREGAWRLVHTESENVCICVVSKLDESTELPAILDALRIDY